MRSDGLWHPRLLEILTGAGHGDLIVVADAGLPVPNGVERVDLLWRRGEPDFVPVLRAVLDECVVEHATVADESSSTLRSELERTLDGIPVDFRPHEELKRLTEDAVVAVRTGAATPYANAVLRCGVAF
jgi:D-ribose pyranase